MTSYHEEVAFKKCNFWQISLLSYLTVNESNVNSIGKIKPSLKAVIEKISEGMHSKNICNFPVKELCKHDNKNWLLDTYRQILKKNRFISRLPTTLLWFLSFFGRSLICATLAKTAENVNKSKAKSK